MADLVTPIQVLAQEADYWVVCKPHNMSFHAESETMGFMQSMYESYPEHNFFPVHRLDKITSGLIILATNKESAAILSKLFEEHQIEKYYLALSAKKPKKKQGAIKGGMKAGRNGNWMLTSEKENWAFTQFFSVAAPSVGLRLFLLKPRTGKTHQLRVALKSLGSPILGDVRYGGRASDRGYLHAFYLGFTWKGEKQTYQKLPEIGAEFQDVEEVLLQQQWLPPTELNWPSN